MHSTHWAVWMKAWLQNLYNDSSWQYVCVTRMNQTLNTKWVKFAPSSMKTFYQYICIRVKVNVWCCQVTSHYLIQCWLRSMLPYDVTMPQCVKRAIKVYCVLCRMVDSFERTTQWHICSNPWDQFISMFFMTKPSVVNVSALSYIHCQYYLRNLEYQAKILFMLSQ